MAIGRLRYADGDALFAVELRHSSTQHGEATRSNRSEG